MIRVAVQRGRSPDVGDEYGPDEMEEMFQTFKN
jgi:hypothetical protein